MRKIKQILSSKRFYIIIFIIIIDLILGDLHFAFQNSSHIPEGYENLEHPMQGYIFNLSTYVIYILFSILVLFYIPKKDLVLLLLSLANLVWWVNEFLDFLLFRNIGLLNIKDYIIVIAFIIVMLYGVRTYRRKKGNTEEIVNVTNIALLKMFFPAKEVLTVNNLLDEKDKVSTELNNLLYHLQHQIKQPFTSLEGLIQLEESDMKQQLMYKCLQDVKSYLHELTNLDYIANHYIPEPVYLNYRDTFNAIKDRIPNSNRSSIHYYETQVEYVKMDKMLLSSILEKLIHNAIVFSKDSTFSKPNINVYIYSHASNLVIEVRDEGIGIEPESREKIFDMFYKGSLKSTGVGLGLYIVKKTLEKLNGKISFESEVNKGTTFKVIIPEIKQLNLASHNKAQSAA